MRVHSALLLTLGLAVTHLVFAGITASGAVVVTLLVPALLGSAAALMGWLGVLYLRRRREHRSWSPALHAAVLAEVLVLVAGGSFLLARLPALAPWTAGSAA